ncbi:MAG TPA: hypothetical protein VG148_18745, partial [Pyrinomonadaceae bacterium]|nr:hypothetical protein [Pyrinomonadaceae bacterium]
MKRIPDKIKDLVEPQAFEQGGNVTNDPARALEAYRFTDVTSDLLARWLDVLADLPRAGGAALALAGARGVGKSHTLAVFGALAGSERLRQTVSDAHVAASARRLSGRRYAVVRVERGTRQTLAGEMAAAFAAVFGGGEAQWAGGAAEMLSVAASRAFGETLVVIVDTAPSRLARVARDDGPALGELAVTARSTGALVALALDDDIEGADGANVALAGTYQIDYLDPENLYRVAEQFVLRKRPQGRARVRDIYESLRASVPGFGWSEARFASLYPVHPLVAEMAAGVRLYVPAFAFLPFAGAVAVRAGGRPALSLVLLDEVFDATEAELRKSPELRQAFAGYDCLAAECVARLPVMQRHQARLILKSLFVLSLDGRGATARELCAALLLAEEPGSDGGATAQIEETLERFAAAARAGSLHAAAEAGGTTRYRFHIASLDLLQPAPAEAAEAPSDSGNPVSGVGPVPARQETSDSTLELTNQGGQGQARPRIQTASTPGALGEETFAEAATASEVVIEDPPQGAAAPAKVPAPSAASLAEQSFRDLFADEELEEVATPEAVTADVASEASVSPAPAAAEPTRPGAGELAEWLRLLTGEAAAAPLNDPAGREAARAALAGWLEAWRARGLEQKFEALPDDFQTTRVWKVAAGVRKSFAAAAAGG